LYLFYKKELKYQINISFMRKSIFVFIIVVCLSISFFSFTISFHPSPTPVASPPTPEFPNQLPSRNLSSIPSPPTPEFPNQLPSIFEPMDIALKYVPLVGAVVAVWKFAVDEKKKIQLSFGQIIKKNNNNHLEKKVIEESIYSIKIENKKRNGKADGCEGWITVEKASIDFPTIWLSKNSKNVDITTTNELFIFNVVSYDKHKEITFINAEPNQDANNISSLNYADALDKKMIIKIGSSNAVSPKPLKKTIKKLMENSK
jgi:hypothetical protein